MPTLSNAMYTSRHIMIDCETKNSDIRLARVTSVGFAEFAITRNNQIEIYEMYSAALSDELAPDAYFDDPLTLLWREAHNVDEMESRMHRAPIREIVDKFREMAHQDAETIDDLPYVWTWRPQFDLPILERNIKLFGLDFPWQYHQVLDAATFVTALQRVADSPRELQRQARDLVGQETRDLNMAAHHPGFDCICQLMAMELALHDPHPTATARFTLNASTDEEGPQVHGRRIGEEARRQADQDEDERSRAAKDGKQAETPSAAQ